MTAMAKQPVPEEAPAHTQGLGDELSIWFKLTPLLKGGLDNPMRILMHMAERYGPVIPINLANQRIVLLTDPEHFKYVLVTKADSYIKYFDGLKPIFGKSMITNDGVLWQKIRMPQQPAFHPDMFAEYIPYFLAAIRTKMDIWAQVAKSGETIEMVEQTWTLAADMICKALFDRDMPFNPHFVFKCVKTYTDVMNHKEIRLKRQAGEVFEITEEDAAKAMEVWASVPPAVFGADPREERERTLLKMIEAAVADPAVPEFDQQQAIDELKQYLWAGTETTALTLAWALYETARNPEAAERIRKEGETGLRRPRADGGRLLGLAYTRAVIQETMRLYPPIWGLIRVASEADEIGGKPINPGDRIVLFAYGAHHNPKLLGGARRSSARAVDGRRRQEAGEVQLPAVRRRQALVHRRRHEPGREHAGAVDPAAPLPARVRRQRAARHQRDRDADAQGRPHVQDPRAELRRRRRRLGKRAPRSDRRRGAIRLLHEIAQLHDAVGIRLAPVEDERLMPPQVVQNREPAAEHHRHEKDLHEIDVAVLERRLHGDRAADDPDVLRRGEPRLLQRPQHAARRRRHALRDLSQKLRRENEYRLAAYTASRPAP